MISRFPDYSILLAGLAALLIALQSGLRPDAFYTGDPGVKLMAARAAASDPVHPFDIPLPVIGADRTPHVEPFLSVHGQHAHAVTSPVFPIVSAPFLAVFGLRGLYVLPAVGFLLSALACAALGRVLGQTQSARLAITAAAISTPFFFYGLEFWEHMPAVACATLGVVLLLNRRPFAGGVLFGLALLFRPESAWFGVATVVSLPLLPTRPPLRVLGQALLGVLVSTVPYEAYVLVHFGTVVPPHLGTNSGEMAASWAATRWSLVRTWFLSAQSESFWATAPCVAGALASLARPKQAPSARFLWSVSLITIILTLLTAPNSGGGQWGTRYLLLAYVPLALLTASAVEQLPRRNALATAALAVAVVGCLWIDRAGYRQLRGTKGNYGRIVDFVSDHVVESTSVVTDVWWLDQVAAAALGERQVFFAPEGATGANIVRRLSDHTVPVVTVVRSATESADTSSWSAGTCYFEERRDRISVRDLVAIQLRHRCRQ